MDVDIMFDARYWRFCQEVAKHLPDGATMPYVRDGITGVKWSSYEGSRKVVVYSAVSVDDAISDEVYREYAEYAAKDMIASKKEFIARNSDATKDAPQ